jgi:hypothetical protein
MLAKHTMWLNLIISLSLTFNQRFHLYQNSERLPLEQFISELNINDLKRSV